MHTQDQTLVGQSLTELESEALFALVEELEENGWGYGFSCLFRCGVFTGPESEFDLCLASRLGERKLQWNLTSPSTVGRSEYEDELRSEERRVGKEWRARGARGQRKKGRRGNVGRVEGDL